MKSFRMVLRVVMVVVIVSLVLPACDMPWDDDDDDKKSPLAPIIGEHHFSDFANNAIFDYEGVFGFEGDTGTIGDTGAGNDWSNWLETLPAGLKTLILLANEVEGTGNKGYYKVYLEIRETSWELHVDQTDMTGGFNYLFGIKGTHQLEPVGSSEYRGNATHTLRWSVIQDKWVSDTGIMEFRIWIEQDAWLEFQMTNDSIPTFQCPFTREGGLFKSQTAAIRFLL